MGGKREAPHDSRPATFLALRFLPALRAGESWRAPRECTVEEVARDGSRGVVGESIALQLVRQSRGAVIELGEVVQVECAPRHAR